MNNPKNITPAHPIQKIHCGECNWEQIIISDTHSNIQCCSWCGFSDLEISKVTQEGAFQKIECATHGQISIAIPTNNIDTEDFLGNLYCPYCG